MPCTFELLYLQAGGFAKRPGARSFSQLCGSLAWREEQALLVSARLGRFTVKHHFLAHGINHRNQDKDKQSVCFVVLPVFIFVHCVGKKR